MSTRFAFVTGHEFGRRALEGLLASAPSLDGELRCELVIELDRSRSAATVGFSSAAEVADQHRIPRLAVTDGSLVGSIDALRKADPHYLLVIGWSRLVSAEVLDLPRVLHGGGDPRRNSPAWGCVGMHPTRLPEGRGQAPIPWTILRGLEKTALSTFHLEDGADTGGIISQHALAVRPRETSSSLFSRFTDLHFHAGEDLALRLAARAVGSEPQDDGAASVWPRRNPKDGLLNPCGDLNTLDRMVRALSGPYPRPFVRIPDGEVRIDGWRVRADSHPGSPGDVVGVDGDELLVVWSSGTLVALRVIPDDLELVRSAGL